MNIATARRAQTSNARAVAICAPATAQMIIALAKSNIDNGAPMASSAALCHSDALSCLGRGDYLYAAKRAIDSLAYSVGLRHPDYIAAKSALTA